VVFQSDLLLHLEIVMLSFCYGKNHNNGEVFTLLLQCKGTYSLRGVSVEGVGEW
jgi:hypothetical protein